MAKRRILVAIVAVVLGGLTATGAASAGESQRGPGDDRPGRGHEAFCDALENRIQHLRAKIGRLEAIADRLEAKIASGELTARQLERARHALAKVEAAQARLQKKLEKLLEVYAARCED